MFIAKRKPLRDGNCGHMVSDQTHMYARTPKNLERNSFEILHLNYFDGCPSDLHKLEVSI